MDIYFHKGIPYGESYVSGNICRITIDDEFLPSSYIPNENLYELCSDYKEIFLFINNKTIQSFKYLNKLKFKRIVCISVTNFDQKISLSSLLNHFDCKNTLETLILHGVRGSSNLYDLNEYIKLTHLRCGDLKYLCTNLYLPRLKIEISFDNIQNTSLLTQICAEQICFNCIYNNDYFCNYLLNNCSPSDFRVIMKLPKSSFYQKDIQRIYDFYNFGDLNSTSLIYLLVYVKKFKINFNNKCNPLNPLYHMIRTSSNVHSKIHGALNIIL